MLLLASYNRPALWQYKRENRYPSNFCNATCLLATIGRLRCRKRFSSASKRGP